MLIDLHWMLFTIVTICTKVTCQSSTTEHRIFKTVLINSTSSNQPIHVYIYMDEHSESILEEAMQ